MLFCEQCQAHVEGSLQRCPLCQSPLTGQPEENAYPVLPPAKSSLRLSLRLAALASTWLVLGVTVRKRGSPMKAVVWQLGVISAVTFLWDLCTGFAGWSLDFVLPIFIPCAQLAAFIVVKALSLRPAEYLFCLTVCILVGFVPLIPLLCGALGVVYPTVICVSISLIALAGLLLFKGSALKDDAVRRLHL